MNTLAMRRAWRNLSRTLGPYRIRPLYWWEAGRVAELERQVFLEPLDLRQVARFLSQPGTIYAAVFDGRRLAAYFGFSIWGAYAHVLANVTHPAYRRQGLGEGILRAMEPVARAGGAKGFLGEVRRSNTAQLRILEGLGWQVVFTVPGFFQSGEDAFIVWRNFSEPRDLSE